MDPKTVRTILQKQMLINIHQIKNLTLENDNICKNLEQDLELAQLSYEQEFTRLRKNISNHLESIYKYSKEVIPKFSECQLIFRQNIPKGFSAWELWISDDDNAPIKSINLTGTCGLSNGDDANSVSFINWMRSRKYIKHVLIV